MKIVSPMIIVACFLQIACYIPTNRYRKNLLKSTNKFLVEKQCSGIFLKEYLPMSQQSKMGRINPDLTQCFVSNS